MSSIVYKVIFFKIFTNRCLTVVGTSVLLILKVIYDIIFINALRTTFYCSVSYHLPRLVRGVCNAKTATEPLVQVSSYSSYIIQHRPLLVRAVLYTASAPDRADANPRSPRQQQTRHPP